MSKVKKVTRGKFRQVEDQTSDGIVRTSIVLSAEPKILIIGAGAAGIACATKLLEHGFKDVRIIEGEDRIGGRIHTIVAADNVYDLGAQFCHGKIGNRVYELVGHTDLLEEHTSKKLYLASTCIRSNGQVVSKAISERLRKIVGNISIHKREYLHFCDDSLGEFLKVQFYHALDREENTDIDNDIADEYFLNLKELQTWETGIPVDEVSARGMLEHWDCEGDFLLNWKDKGFIEFLRFLMKVEENNKKFGVLDSLITLNMTATNIIWRCNDGKVEVACRNITENMKVDHVIVTVSLGVLKDCYRTMFSPALPTETERAIQGLAYGITGKIFLEFPYRFWPMDWTGFKTLWRKEDDDAIKTTSRAWVRDICGFACVNYQPRVLLGWIVGKYVGYMETLTKNEISENCMYLLKRFLPSWVIPTPLNVNTSKWLANRHFCGSFSFHSLYTDTCHTNALALSNPLTILAYAPLPEGHAKDDDTRPLTIKPVVQFAGEATSEHFFSTVHGAVETGWREADRLAGYYYKNS